MKILPDVPSAKDLGIEADYSTVRGFVTLKGVPDDRLKILEDGLIKAMAGQMYTTYIETSGQASDSVAGRAVVAGATRQLLRGRRKRAQSAGHGQVAMRRTDVVVAAVALAGVRRRLRAHLSLRRMPAAMVSGLGAEVFPRLVIGVIAFLAVLAAFGIGNPPMETPAPVPRMVWITAAVLFAFVGAVELIGMWPAALVFLVGLGLLWGERSVWKLGASAVVLCAALYGLFVRVLGGNFPKGLIANLWS